MGGRTPYRLKLLKNKAAETSLIRYDSCGMSDRNPNDEFDIAR